MDQLSSSKLFANTLSKFFVPSQHLNHQIQKIILPIKSNRVDVLHAITIGKTLVSEKDEHQKNLLHYAAFYKSASCLLYIFRKGVNPLEVDSQGRSVGHICAYTGHVDQFRTLRFVTKLWKIRNLNEQYLKVLNKYGYKRTDMRGGELKYQVSESRKNAFFKMQQEVLSLFANYLKNYSQSSIEMLSLSDKITSRNILHLACLNKYQRCINFIQLALEDCFDFNIHFDVSLSQIWNQVDTLFQPDQKIDPRQFQSVITQICQVFSKKQLDSLIKQFKKSTQEKLRGVFESKDKNGQTLLYLASENGSTNMINLLKNYEKRLNNNQSTQDQISNQKNQNQEKSGLIKVASNNLARSHILDLCEASKDSHSQNINFLISCGQNINKKKTIFGTFPLLEAVKAFKGKLEPIRILLKSGADINEQDTNGWTILHHVSEKGAIDILKEVLKTWQEGLVPKINVNKLTNKGYHMLHLAAMQNRYDIIELMSKSQAAKELGLKITQKDGEGCTMLHHAARKGALQSLKIILEIAPELIYEGDIRSNTALHYAASNNHPPCIKYLIYFDSDSDKLIAMQNTQGKLAKDLTIQKQSFSNIFAAAKSGDVNTVRKMISEIPSLKNIITPQKERSLLMLSILNKHYLVAKYLKEVGVSLDLKDKLNKTAIDYLVELEKTEGKEQVLLKNIRKLLFQ